MKRKVVFVHGLGVRKDSRGMFTDIQKSFLEDENFKDIECIFTDLNIIKISDENQKENLILNPLSVQAEILKKAYEREVEESKNKKEEIEIVLICHSQGCVVAGIADWPNIKKIFFLAPPTNNDLNRTVERFKKRPGTIIDLGNDSTVTRSDGSKTIIPKEYWTDRKDLNYLECYKKLGSKTGKEKVKIILANQDEVVANDHLEELINIGEVFQIDGNHDFDNNRGGLAEIIKQNF